LKIAAYKFQMGLAHFFYVPDLRYPQIVKRQEKPKWPIQFFW
jgi:hypothetical protein